MKTLTHMDIGQAMHAGEGGLGPALSALSTAVANVFHELGNLLRQGPVREYRSAKDRSLTMYGGAGSGEAVMGQDRSAKKIRVFFDDTAEYEQA